VKRLLSVLACSMLALGMVGCAEGAGDTAPQKQTETVSQVRFIVLDNLSRYPFLAIKNSGTGKAENVQVVETESKKPVMAMAILKLMGEELKPLGAPKPMTLEAGDGAQYQLLSQDVLKYTVTWTENGKQHSADLAMKEPGKIETH